MKYHTNSSAINPKGSLTSYEKKKDIKEICVHLSVHILATGVCKKQHNIKCMCVVESCGAHPYDTHTPTLTHIHHTHTHIHTQLYGNAMRPCCVRMAHNNREAVEPFHLPWWTKFRIEVMKMVLLNRLFPLFFESWKDNAQRYYQIYQFLGTQKFVISWGFLPCLYIQVKCF